MKKNLTEIRKTHLGRYLYELNRAYKLVTIPYIQQHGFEEFTEGQLSLLSQIDVSQPTPTQELVARMGISKQAISRMMRQCEKNGYIEQIQSSVDTRSKDIVFSKKGIKLMQTAAQAIEVAENAVEARLGERKFSTLKKILGEACKDLDLLKIN